MLYDIVFRQSNGHIWITSYEEIMNAGCKRQKKEERRKKKEAEQLMFCTDRTAAVGTFGRDLIQPFDLVRSRRRAAGWTIRGQRRSFDRWSERGQCRQGRLEPCFDVRSFLF